MLFRAGAARNTDPVTVGGGDGGLDTRGNGGLVLATGAGTGADVVLTDALDADCG